MEHFRPSVGTKKLDHLYSSINHHRTTAKLKETLSGAFLGVSGGVWSISGGVWRLSECQENPRSQHFLECRNGLLRNPGKFNFCRTPIGPTMKRLFEFLRV